jgi:hypothetical protein
MVSVRGKHEDTDLLCRSCDCGRVSSQLELGPEAVDVDALLMVACVPV